MASPDNQSHTSQDSNTSNDSLVILRKANGRTNGHRYIHITCYSQFRKLIHSYSHTWKASSLYSQLSTLHKNYTNLSNFREPPLPPSSCCRAFVTILIVFCNSPPDTHPPPEHDIIYGWLLTDSHQILPVCSSAWGTLYMLKILRSIDNSKFHGHFKRMRVSPKKSSTSYFCWICLKLTELINHYTGTIIYQISYNFMQYISINTLIIKNSFTYNFLIIY